MGTPLNWGPGANFPLCPPPPLKGPACNCTSVPVTFEMIPNTCVCQALKVQTRKNIRQANHSLCTDCFMQSVQRLADQGKRKILHSLQRKKYPAQTIAHPLSKSNDPPFNWRRNV